MVQEHPACKGKLQFSDITPGDTIDRERKGTASELQIKDGVVSQR